MESNEIISDFRAQLDAVQNAGQQQVEVAALRSYLDALERDAHSSQEFRNREHAGMLAHYSAKTQHSLEMVKAVIETGKSALDALLIVNGGAAVALLGVMSNLAGREGGASLARYLSLPLLQFGVGVLLGVIGFGLRYLSQAAYSESTESKDGFHRAGDALRVAAVLGAIAGYILFGFGVVNAYFAVQWSFAA
jgi:hypothetical protein